MFYCIRWFKKEESFYVFRLLVFFFGFLISVCDIKDLSKDFSFKDVLNVPFYFQLKNESEIEYDCFFERLLFANKLNIFFSLLNNFLLVGHFTIKRGIFYDL